MRIRTIRLLSLACGLVTLSQASFGQSFGISIAVREGTASTTIGAASAATAAIEWVNAPGVQVTTDGTYQLVTFTFGTDAATYFAGTAGAGQTNNFIDGNFAGLEHLRIVNTNGITKPSSIYIDEVISTPSGGSPVVLTDFLSIPTAIANGTTNVLFREPAISGSTSQNFARNFQSSAVTNVGPDGVTDPANQAGRVNFRFSTPDAVTSSTGWGRAIASSTNAAIPANPTIAVSPGSTLTFRLAILANNPLYGYVGYDGLSSDNNWSNVDNWGSRDVAAPTINAPNSTSATALIDEPLPVGEIVPRTINLDVPVKVQNLQITSPVPYTISGTESLTVTRAAVDVSPTITVEAGNHTISAPVTIASDSTAAVQSGYTPLIWTSTGSSLNITAPLTINSYVAVAAGAPVNSLDKKGGGTASIIDAQVNTLRVAGGTLNLAPNASHTVGSTTTLSGNGSKLSVSPVNNSVKTFTTLSVTGSNSTLAINSEAGSDVVATTINLGLNSKLNLEVAGKASLLTTSLNLNGTVTPTATLNLGDDGVLIDYASASPFTTIRSQILTAFNGGAWDGKGITSSLLATHPGHAIGYLEAGGLASFMGRAVPDATAVGIRYTLRGDHDLDADVDFDDLLKLAQNYDPAYDPSGTGPKLWGEGDFNYDGIVNFDDLLAMAQNYGAAALNDAQLTSLGETFSSDWQLALSVVPEPTSLGLIGGLTMMIRRRR